LFAVYTTVVAGMTIVRRVESLPTVQSKPDQPVIISDCGEVITYVKPDGKGFLSHIIAVLLVFKWCGCAYLICSDSS